MNKKLTETQESIIEAAKSAASQGGMPDLVEMSFDTYGTYAAQNGIVFTDQEWKAFLKQLETLK